MADFSLAYCMYYKLSFLPSSKAGQQVVARRPAPVYVLSPSLTNTQTRQFWKIILVPQKIWQPCSGPVGDWVLLEKICQEQILKLSQLWSIRLWVHVYHRPWYRQWFNSGQGRWFYWYQSLTHSDYNLGTSDYNLETIDYKLGSWLLETRILVTII